MAQKMLLPTVVENVLEWSWLHLREQWAKCLLFKAYVISRLRQAHWLKPIPVQPQHPFPPIQESVDDSDDDADIFTDQQHMAMGEESQMLANLKRKMPTHIFDTHETLQETIQAWQMLLSVPGDDPTAARLLWFHILVLIHSIDETCTDWIWYLAGIETSVRHLFHYTPLASINYTLVYQFFLHAHAHVAIEPPVVSWTTPHADTVVVWGADSTQGSLQPY